MIWLRLAGWAAWHGLASGAILGTILGSLIYPLVGTLFGGLVGAALGNIVGFFDGVVLVVITRFFFDPPYRSRRYLGAIYGISITLTFTLTILFVGLINIFYAVRPITPNDLLTLFISARMSAVDSPSTPYFERGFNAPPKIPCHTARKGAISCNTSVMIW